MSKKYEMQRIKNDEPEYPSSLIKYLANKATPFITTIGNINLVQNKPLAIFNSSKCPGKVIMQTYDLMKNIKWTGITLISGFHSPIERECLKILLNGKPRIIVCPARGIEGMRIKAELKTPLDEGRLLLLSPFNEDVKRITSEMALVRNRFIAALSDSIFIPYADPNSKTEHLCKEILSWNKPVYTFQGESNANLIELGVKSISISATGNIMNYACP